jgi:hypothetical protein
VVVLVVVTLKPVNVGMYTTLSKKYPTLGWENKVLHLGGYNTQSPSK